MRIFTLLTTAGLIISSICLSLGQGTKLELDQFKWKNRLILISVPETENQHLIQQLEIFSGQESGIMDRDLRIIQIIGSDKILIDSEPLAADNIVTIRQQLRLENRVFQLLLIGKDGTVKLRSEKPVPISDIFGLIDSMPMRQQEMRKKSGQS